MEREELDRLLAEYATGGLSEEDRKKLFAAALSDQALFDQLMEEDALREVLELPGARDRLIDALQVDEARLLMPASVAAPAPARRTPVWLAWAAGVGVVFVSGALSYVLLDPGTAGRLAQVAPQSQREVKPFVAPPERPAPRVATKVVVDAPPLVAEARKAEPLPALNIPLPAAPPLMADQPAKDAVTTAKKVSVGSVEVARSRADTVAVAAESAEVKPAPGPVGNALTATNAPMRAELAGDAAREKAVAASVAVAGNRVREKMVAAGAPGAVADRKARDKGAAARADLVAAQAPVSAWRRTGEGVWIRLAPAETVGREDTIVIRFTPLRDGPVTLADATGRVLVRRDGRGGEELELAVPRAVLAGARGGEVALAVTGGATISKIVLRFR